ncbi:MAG: FAD-binding oxidoreductase [Clostridium sp.]|nr:FAD-binding oxidoreductase [Clostridium sp.]
MNIDRSDKTTKSYWIDSSNNTNYPTLDNDISVDIAIVGGGITGIAATYQLLKSGMKIALLEGLKIAQGTTGYTTGKITSQHGLIYAKLIKQFGRELAQQYATVNEMAIKEIKKIADQNNINCDYSIQPAFIYTRDDSFVQQIQEEAEAAKSLGISATFVSEIPLPIPIKAGLRFDNQAQFHPRKFLLPLVEEAHKKGALIFEESKIEELEQNGEGKYILTALNGHTVTAKKVIIASRYPFYNKKGGYNARISQLKTYAIVIKAKEKFPGGMFINAEYPNRSLRVLNGDSEEYILVVGDSHKIDHMDDPDTHYKALVDFAGELFTVEDVCYRWFTQDCMTVDGIPYVGNFLPGTPDLYIATGFGKWGITNGLASSILLKDLMLVGSSPWKQIYDPAKS